MEPETIMKALVKELLTSRLAYCALAFILALAACVGIHNYAWADVEDDELIAEWRNVSVDGSTAILGGSIGLKTLNVTSEDTIGVEITSAGYPVPPSIVYLYTESGTFVSGVFRKTLDPGGNNAQIDIPTNIPVDSFTSAKLYRAVFVTFKTEVGEAPESQTVIKNSPLTLPDLVDTDDKAFLGWIEESSDNTEPLLDEYIAKEDVTLVAVWKAIETPETPVTPETPETSDSVEEVAEEPESGANEAGSIIPQTGDNQNIALVTCGFSVTALLAAGALVATRRKSSLH
ncbi:MAG: LPXTG cell wall anchor domain-containing protein [Anaerotardibacter sp.]